MIKMKAADTLHISALGPNHIAPGETFDVSEEVAADLEKRGLASRDGAKKDSAPKNKMDAVPANKADNPESAPDPEKSREPISGNRESGFVATRPATKGGRKSKA